MKRFIGILMCALMLFCPFLKAQAADTCPIEQIGADVRQMANFIIYFITIMYFII